MEKRVLIAVFLSFLVIYAYQALVPAPPPPRSTPAAPPGTAPGAPQRPSASETPKVAQRRAAAPHKATT